MSAPGEKIPRLGRAYLLVALATLAGAPALLVYAAISLIQKTTDPMLADFLTGVVLPVLFAAGTILPGATIASVPRELRPSWALVAVTVFILTTLLGVVLMSQDNPYLFALGTGLGTAGCVVNLTLATSAVGSAVPGWGRLGSARQTRNPLLVAIGAILLGRLLLCSSPPNANWINDAFLTWVNVVLIVLEALLAIGAIYILFNRLWLIAQLSAALSRIRQQED